MLSERSQQAHSLHLIGGHKILQTKQTVLYPEEYFKTFSKHFCLFIGVSVIRGLKLRHYSAVAPINRPLLLSAINAIESQLENATNEKQLRKQSCNDAPDYR